LSAAEALAAIPLHITNQIPVEGKVNTPELSVIPVPSVPCPAVSTLSKFDDITALVPVKSAVNLHLEDLLFEQLYLKTHSTYHLLQM
jgi:hypothetical protein